MTINHIYLMVSVGVMFAYYQTEPSTEPWWARLWVAFLNGVFWPVLIGTVIVIGFRIMTGSEATP